MWLVFSVVSGALYAAESLLQRFHLRKQPDIWTFALFYSLIGALISFPFMLASPTIPSSPGVWAVVALNGLLIVLNNYLFFKATGLLEISVVNSLMKIRLVWVLLFGVVILSDPFNWLKLAGTVCAMLAGWIILHSFTKPGNSRGVILVLALTLVNASIIILFKYLLSYFNAMSLTFFADFLPAALFTVLIAPQSVSRIKGIFKDDWRIIFLASTLGAFSSIAMNLALSLHDAASVVVINEVFLILVLVGEHIYLKEREHTWIKVVSVSLALAGAILIQVSA